ncbi:MAG: hypothetical protein K2J67_00340 [Lachnospiraceae bacterium]|nr:hypothetical protein [Lachnospiraceae bacterium]
MLGKLLKYDMKNLGASMIPMYLCLAVIVVIDRIIQMLRKIDALSRIPAVGYIANTTHILSAVGVIILFVMLLILGILYYRNNIMGDQGYLMHTLPVTSYQLVASKVITVLSYVVITTIVSYFVLAVSIGKLFWGKKVYMDFLYFMGESKAICIIIVFSVYFLICFMYLLMVAYLAFSIAYSSNTKHRNIAAGAIFLIMYIIGKCGELAVVFGLFCMGITDMDLEKIDVSEILYLCIPLIIIYLALVVVSYLLAGRWLQKRLNID